MQQAGPPQRRRGQVDRPGRQGLGPGIHGPGIRHRLHGQIDRDRRVDPLTGFAVDVDQCGPQAFVALGQARQGGADEGRIERRRRVQAERDIVGDQAGRALLQEPQPRLRAGGGVVLGRRQAGDRRGRHGGLDRPGQAFDRRVFQECGQARGTALQGPQPGQDGHRLQAGPAEIEEVGRHPGRRQTEHRGPDLGDHGLDPGARPDSVRRGGGDRRLRRPVDQPRSASVVPGDGAQRTDRAVRPGQAPCTGSGPGPVGQPLDRPEHTRQGRAAPAVADPYRLSRRRRQEVGQRAVRCGDGGGQKRPQMIEPGLPGRPIRRGGADIELPLRPVVQLQHVEEQGELGGGDRRTDPPHRSAGTDVETQTAIDVEQGRHRRRLGVFGEAGGGSRPQARQTGLTPRGEGGEAVVGAERDRQWRHGRRHGDQSRQARFDMPGDGDADPEPVLAGQPGDQGGVAGQQHRDGAHPQRLAGRLDVAEQPGAGRLADMQPHPRSAVTARRRVDQRQNRQRGR